MRPAGFALVVEILMAGLLVWFALQINSQAEKIERLERLACAFVQYEDGSVRPRTEDATRYRCLEEVGR